jgi:hypothetical protein
MERGLKIFLILGLFIILGLSFVSAGNPNNFWNKIMGKSIIDSYCLDTCTSLGYQCGTGRICENIINCGTCLVGYDCLNGQCIPQNQTNQTNYNCTDSDNGINYFIRGYLIDSVHNSDYKDYCSGNITLREYWCGFTDYQYEEYNCSIGCVDGACIECAFDSQCLNSTQKCIKNKCIIVSTCNDSDGGVDYYTKGTLTYVYNEMSIILNDKAIVDDYCSDNYINEAFCYLDSKGVEQYRWGESVQCKYGCFNGACKRWYITFFNKAV